MTIEASVVGIKEGVKRVMKVQGKTYEDLAKHLKLSTPTVKRILNRDELSLERLVAILKWLEIEFDDFITTLGRTLRPLIETYTEEQEIFLANHPQYFAYFCLLMDGRSPDSIATEYDLSERSTEKYLRELEKLELITIGKNGNVIVPIRKNMLPAGDLHSKCLKTILHNLAEFFGSKSQTMSAPNGKLMLDYGEHPLSQESFERLAAAEKEFRREVRLTSDVEKKVLSEEALGKLFRVSWYIYDDPKARSESMANIYGDIPNLDNE